MPIVTQAPVENMNTPQTPNAMNSISGMLDMAGKLQSLQSGGIQLQAQQQANKERQAAMQVIPTLMQPDGTFDLSQANKIMAVAPQTGADYVAKLADTNSKSAAANQGLLNLNTSEQSYVGQALPKLIGQPASVVMPALADMAEQTPQTANFVAQLNHQIGQAVTTGNGDAKATQDAIDKVLDFNSKRVLTLQQQNDLLTPKYQNVGGQQVNINPAAGASNLTNTLSPSERSGVVFNSQGQPITVTKPENGLNPTISGTPVNGKAQQPFVMPQNENDITLKFAQGIRQDANTMASAYTGTQAFANNAINYAKGATTGVGSELINGLKGQFAGIPWTSGTVTDANLLGHALSQMTGSLVSSTGLSTNQGQSLASNQIADGHWDKPAIQTASREIRALSSGANLFNQAIENNTEKVSQTDPSGSQFVARDVKNAWSKVADVNAFKLYDALKNKEADPQGLSNPEGTGILDKLGGPTKSNPKGSVIYQQTINNIRKMQSIVNGNLR